MRSMLRILLAVLLGLGQQSFDDLKKAAEAGDASAQFSLAVMYQSGDGAPKDPLKAVEWYTRAANQGDGSAQFILGMMYSRGDGIPVDLG